MKNTSIHYIYRDACNYKIRSDEVVAGLLTEAEREEIIACCDSGVYFIASQVSLPENRFERWTEDDHPWFEFDDGVASFESTDAEPTLSITAAELLEKFRAAEGNWDDSITSSLTSATPPVKDNVGRCKKNALCLSLDEFREDVKKVFGSAAEVVTDWDGITLEDLGCQTDEAYRRLADYYGVGEVTSIHTDDAEYIGVWVVYRDIVPEYNRRIRALYDGLLGYMVELLRGDELYNVLHHSVGMTDSEIVAEGIFTEDEITEMTGNKPKIEHDESFIDVSAHEHMLLDAVVEDMLCGEKLGDVIRELDRLGFTREDLLRFRFSECDINDALSEEEDE